MERGLYHYHRLWTVQESKEGIISLDDFHPRAVETAVNYMYAGAYHSQANTLSDANPTDIGRLLLHVKVYTLADYSALPHLGYQAICNFYADASTQWQSIDFARAVKELQEVAAGQERQDSKTCR